MCGVQRWAVHQPDKELTLPLSQKLKQNNEIREQAEYYMKNVNDSQRHLVHSGYSE